jgi:hypothetical protein
MQKISFALPKTIAVIRILTSVFFLLFGQYKILGPKFAHGGFQQYLQGFIQNGAVNFYQPILADLILPHAVFFGYVVGVVEMLFLFIIFFVADAGQEWGLDGRLHK